jgi:hypothetical protein
MANSNTMGNLLSFPAPMAVSGSPAENWSAQVLRTRDNLVSALEFLRIAYNEMLAGMPVKASDEILAKVETILRNGGKIPAYTVVAAIRIRRKISPEPKRRVLLLFPANLKKCLAVEGEETGDTMKMRSMEGTSSETSVDSVATILEQETQATINDWSQRNMVNDLLSCSPDEHKARTSHLPKLFGDLVNRLRYPLPARTRALVSPGAAAYGLLRRKQQYTAAMLVEEARMLEVSIFHTLHTNAYRIDFSMLLADVMVIADEVDSQLAQAIESHTQAHKEAVSHVIGESEAE